MSIVDSLVVELSLDPSKFESGRRQAEDAFNKTKLAAKKTGDEIEGQTKKLAEGFGAVKTNVLGLFAAFTGVGIAAFATQMIHADAATGRAAKTFGMATKELGAWQGAVELAGGKSADANASIGSLIQTLETAKVTGDPSALLPWAQWAQIDVRGLNGLKTATELYLELADKMKSMKPEAAFTLANRLGVAPGMIPMLMQGREAAQAYLDQMAKIGNVTQEDAAAAIKFENAWTQAWTRVKAAARGFYPILTDLADQITIAFSPKALDLWAQRVVAVKAFFTKPEAEFWKEQKKFEDMRKEFLEWQSNGGAKKYTGGDTDKFMGQAGADAGAGSAFKSQAEKEAFIRSEFTKNGHNPDIAMRVAKSEGFNNFKGDYDATGKPTSFGAFQLHYPGIGRNTADGLGTQFTKETGLDARDPANERAAIAWVARNVGKTGWGPWHGWKGDSRAGLGTGRGGSDSAATADLLRGLGRSRMQGLQGGAPLAAEASGADNSRTSTSTSDVTINGGVHINAPQATDAAGIGKGIGGAIKSNLYTPQADGGPH